MNDLPDEFLEWFLVHDVALAMRDLIVLRTARELERVVFDLCKDWAFEC